MNERCIGVMRLSPKMLQEALHMPEGSEIYGIEWSFAHNTILVYVTHPEFLPGPEGCPPIPVKLWITTHTKIAKDQDGFELIAKSYEGKWS